MKDVSGFRGIPAIFKWVRGLGLSTLAAVVFSQSGCITVEETTSSSSSSTSTTSTSSSSTYTASISATSPITANGSSTSDVTITLYDSNGDAASGVDVVLTVSGSNNTIIQPLATGSNGQTTATIASSSSQSKIIGISSPSGITTTGTVVFQAGTTDQVQSSITATSPVAADGSSTSSIAITLKDNQGNPVTGQSITLSVSGSNNTLSTCAATDANGGSTCTLSSTTAETKTIEVTSPVSGISTTATFSAADASTATSTITGTSPTLNDGSDTSTITITLLDASSNPIEGTTPTFSASGSANTYGTCSATSSSGVSTCTLKSTTAEVKTLSITSPISMAGGTATFHANAASAVNSTITGTGSVTADGTSTSTVTITIKDTANAAIEGVTPTFSATDTGSNNVYGTCSAGSAAGVSTCTLASSTAETKTLSIVTPVSKSDGTVIFTGGTPVAANSTITGTSNIVADGATNSTITITLKDTNSNPVSGVTPTFTSTGSNNTLGACGVSDGNGQSTCTLNTTTAETKTLAIATPVSKTDGTVTFLSAASLTYTNVTSADFGNVFVGTKVGDATLLTFTVSNGGGVTATTMADGAGLAAPFDFYGGTYPGIGGTCSTTLAAAATCTVVVSFNPTSSGAAADSIDISYNNGIAGGQSATHAIAGFGETVTKIDGGDSHACALLSSGRVMCWGDDTYGQLGDNTLYADKRTPTEVSGISTATDIAVGEFFSCAIYTESSNNKVKCWGRDNMGQLGNDTSLNQQPIPVEVSGITTASTISAGKDHVCTALTGQTIQCWGREEYGQLGDGAGASTTCSATNCEPTPVTVSTITNATDIAVGTDHSCAILATNAVNCWGRDNEEQLGDGAGATDQATPVATNALSANPSDIDAGDNHTCALLVDNTIECWGDDTEGQLGDSAGFGDQNAPTAVMGVANATAIALGHSHSCARLSTNAINCWGSDDEGQLGDNAATTDLGTPQAVSGVANATQVYTSHNGSCYTSSSATAHCWGANAQGQGGDGTLVQHNTMLSDVLGFPLKVIQVDAGTNHTCALTNTGIVKCWGDDTTHTQQGTGGGGDSSVPVNVNVITAGAAGTTATQIALGSNHSCALMLDQTILCWGDDANGQIGNNAAQMDQSAPTAVSGVTTALAIASGDNHSCAVLAAGTVQCWGLDSTGELGNGSAAPSDCGGTCEPTPVTVSTVTTATGTIAAGGNHTCVLKSNNRLSCWGKNDVGQLGLGSTSTQAYTPQEISGFEDVTSVAVGTDHTCAINSSNRAYCWGGDTFGQLGDDANTVQKVSPTTIGVSSTATSISGGNAHGCVTLSTGATYTFGKDNKGQLGIGGGSSTCSSNACAPTPQLISVFSNGGSCGSGEEHTCVALTDGSVQCSGENSQGELGDGNTTDLTTFTAVDRL